MKSGSKANTLLGTHWWMRTATSKGWSREPLTSMEKRRWLCRRYCMPGAGCPGSSPLSVGEKALDSDWGSPPRGPSCRSERERHQPLSRALPSGRGGGVLPTSILWAGSEGVVREGEEGLRGNAWLGGPRPLTLIAPVVELVELLCELSQGLLNGLSAGHGQGEAALKVLHHVHVRRDQAAGPETGEERGAATIGNRAGQHQR